VKDFETYFQHLGYPAFKLEKLNEMLKNAVSNSLKKGYHGGMQVIHPIPEPKNSIPARVEAEQLFNVGLEDNQDTILQKLFSRYRDTVQFSLAMRETLSPG